ncbi:hydrogenase expression/formation protein HypE [Infirmifilum sp.]|uniref:hydrogenase expression/formation protein HypE n=1 Tax=Infirmifilum sp. TaxID=2856575 RepID=UPI003D0C2F4F
MSKIDALALAHGQGGSETIELLRKVVFSRVTDNLKRVEGGVGIDKPDDGSLIPLPDGKFLVVSVDSYTVNPPFFPGGNIGSLAASGSINDVVMMGGRPIAMLDSIVAEEGLPLKTLEEIVDSLISVLEKEGVALIGGDFKVMPKGQLDRIVITTVGIGVAVHPIVDEPKPGDKIIVTDYIGDHGTVILMSQLGLGDVEEIAHGLLKSDSKPLTPLLTVFEEFAGYIHAARDPTRGGLAGVLNEWAQESGLIMVVRDEDIPVREPVKRYAEMLGVDPVYLASEGVAVLSVASEKADIVLERLVSSGFKNARIIGEVKQSEKYKSYVLSKTAVGGYRVIEPPRGVLVPRIC